MFTLIPVLPVSEPCHWCEPQDCFEASLWWGGDDCLSPVLMVFYTKDAARLEPDVLNSRACDILVELTRAIKPGAEHVIEPGELFDSIGQAGVLPCYWDDFRPAVMLGYGSFVRIPAAEVSEAQAE